jgi:putative oxidoreductase
LLSERALASVDNPNTTLAIFEWSAEDGCAVDDAWDAIAQGTPGLGYTVSHEAILSSLAMDPHPVFRTDVMCQNVPSLHEPVSPLRGPPARTPPKPSGRRAPSLIMSRKTVRPECCDLMPGFDSLEPPENRTGSAPRPAGPDCRRDNISITVGLSYNRPGAPCGRSSEMSRAIPDSDHQLPVVTTARSDAATAPGTMTTTVVRALARALTSAVYIAGGYAVVRAPGGRVGKAADTLAKIRRVVPLPIDDELIVRVNGGAQLAAGAALALGIKPRFSAAVLAASLLPTTIAGHAFWTVDDPSERQVQQVQFLKNMAMLGGLLFALVDSPRSAR